MAYLGWKGRRRGAWPTQPMLPSSSTMENMVKKISQGWGSWPSSFSLKYAPARYISEAQVYLVSLLPISSLNFYTTTAWNISEFVALAFWTSQENLVHNIQHVWRGHFVWAFCATGNTVLSQLQDLIMPMIATEEGTLVLYRPNEFCWLGYTNV